MKLSTVALKFYCCRRFLQEHGEFQALMKARDGTTSGVMG